MDNLTEFERAELFLKVNNLVQKYEQRASDRKSERNEKFLDFKHCLGVISVGNAEHIFTLFLANVGGEESLVLIPAEEE